MLFQRPCRQTSRCAIQPAIKLQALPDASKTRCVTMNALPIVVAATSATANASLGESKVPQPIPGHAEQSVLARTPSSHTAPRCLSIVTGASRGLGAAIARLLAMQGPPVPAPVMALNRINGSGAADTICSMSGSMNPDASPAVSLSYESQAPSGFIHDLILLASDATRLDRFVQMELNPLLAKQQQRHQALRNHHFQQEQHLGIDKASATSPSIPGTKEASGSSFAASAALSPLPFTTHIRTASFDLGDLSALGAQTSRLLSVADEPQNGEEEVTPPLTEPGLCQTSTADMTIRASATATAGNGTGAGAASRQAVGALEEGPWHCDDMTVGGGGGLLPRPLSAYTHVLLVHNAGQVGDLVPLELQSLVNIRRQTDLNVTSFAHLTAAVLRAFLHAPLDAMAMAKLEEMGEKSPQAQEKQEQVGGQSPIGGAPNDGRTDVHSLPFETHGTTASESVPMYGGAATATRATAKPSSSQDPHPQRRVITIVNISSVSVDQPYEHFSLYGMGKAARHMLVRSVAHEAALREAELAAVAEGCAGVVWRTAPGAMATSPSASSASQPSAAMSGSQMGSGAVSCSHAAIQGQPVARVRALSYAPGAIDTEMQASAREALPAGPLKSRFEENARSGRLVDPRVSAQVLFDILSTDAYDNGAHVDYYSTIAEHEGGNATSTHPLTRH